MADSGKPPAPDLGASAASSAAAFLDEAREKLQGNDVPAALICLRTVAGLAGCPPEARVDAAKMLAQAGDTEGAIAAYLEAGKTYLNVAKDTVKARHAFQAGHALDVHNLDIIFMLGQADVNEGRLQDGLAKFIDVLRKSNLKHVPALFAAGCIYQSNGQFDQAMLAFKKVLDREKEHVEATVRIGQLYQSKEQMPDAIGYYIQAAQLARESQHWGTARQIASMVQAIDPTNQKARMLLDELDEQGHGPEEISSDEPVGAAPPAPPAQRTNQGAPAAARPSAPAPAAAQASGRMNPTAPNAAQTARPSAPPPAQKVAPAPPPAAKVVQPPPPAKVVQPPPVVAQVAAKASPPKAPDAPPVAAANVSQPAPGRINSTATDDKIDSTAMDDKANSTATNAAKPADAPPASADLDRARQMLAAIEAQRQAAQQDLQLLLQTREELQKALGEQRTLLETATMRKTELETNLANAQTSLEEAKHAQDVAVAQSGEGKEKADSMAAERGALESALASLRTEADALAARKTADETAVRELAALRDQTAAEVAALTAKMQDAKKLTDELEAIRTAAGTADEQAARAQTLSAELIALEAKRSAGQSDVSAAEENLAKLQAQMAQALSDATEAQNAKTKAQGEAQTLSAQVAELTATVQDLEQRAAAGAAAMPPAAPCRSPGQRRTARRARACRGASGRG